MTELTKKLTEAEEALKSNLTQYQELERLIVMQQGAIQMLQQLIKEEEANASD